MSKRNPKHVTIPVTPETVQRIDALAAAERRSRTNWLTVQIERLAQQQPLEQRLSAVEERSAA